MKNKTELIELSDRAVFKCGNSYYRIRFRARRPEKSLKVLPVVLLLDSSHTAHNNESIPEVDQKSEFLILEVDPEYYGWFKHFKDQLYFAWGTATKSTDQNKRFVIYEQLYIGTGLATCYRPMDNFNELVTRKETTVPRFTKITG